MALAYGLSPLVLLQFTKTIDPQLDHIESIKYQASSIKRAIQNGLFFTLLVAFDLRLAYLVMIAVVIYVGYTIFDKGLKNNSVVYHLSSIINQLAIPLLTATFVHMFWILPMVTTGGGLSSVGEQFVNPGMLKFLSFADFSHAMSLLHPNWPENLFGKVYFLQPEYLILPILAFMSLVFIPKEKQEPKSFIIHHSSFIIYFSLLSLFGAFLAKGANDPFGEIYQWCFVHIPGFVMFRDPTKFYLYIALGYSILIPFVLDHFSELINDLRLKINDKTIIKKSFVIHHSSFIIFLVFWCFTIRAVFIGQVAGNFQPLQLKDEYVALKNILIKDTDPSRALWIPKQDKFVYTSAIHPVITADELFQNASVSAMTDIIKTPQFEKIIRENGIGYVIVPNDPENKFFLSDYKVESSLRNNLVSILNLTSLHPVAGFDSLAVYTSDHEPMVIKYPDNLKRLQYYSNIGTAISASFAAGFDWIFSYSTKMNIVILVLYLSFSFLCRRLDSQAVQNRISPASLFNLDHVLSEYLLEFRLHMDLRVYLPKPESRYSMRQLCLASWLSFIVISIKYLVLSINLVIVLSLILHH